MQKMVKVISVTVSDAGISKKPLTGYKVLKFKGHKVEILILCLICSFEQIRPSVLDKRQSTK